MHSLRSSLFFKSVHYFIVGSYQNNPLATWLLPLELALTSRINGCWSSGCCSRHPTDQRSQDEHNTPYPQIRCWCYVKIEVATTMEKNGVRYTRSGESVWTAFSFRFYAQCYHALFGAHRQARQVDILVDETLSSLRKRDPITVRHRANHAQSAMVDCT